MWTGPCGMEGALPLNQGGFGTRVGHAFAQALTNSAQEKYGVPRQF